MIEKSCGTVPYSIRDGKIFYLLVKTKSNGFCGLPKGHVDDGECEVETALRETFEETSLKPTVNSEARYEVTYPTRSGNQRVIVYFAADFQNQTPMRNGDFEDFTYLILPYEEAYEALSMEVTKSVLKKANAFLINSFGLN